jgi:hypothetical protein
MREDQSTRRRISNRTLGTPLLILAILSLVWFLIDYVGHRPAGLVRVASSTIFISCGLAGILLLLGAKRAAYIGGALGGIITAVSALAALPNLPVEPPSQRVCGPRLQFEAYPMLGEDHAAAPNIELAETSFEVRYSRGQRTDLALRSRIVGDVQQGNILYLLAWADPATNDSTARHNPGNGRYYLVKRIIMEHQGCFGHSSTPYSGFCGITSRFIVALMGIDTATQLEHKRDSSNIYREHGFAKDDLGEGVYQLQYFDVPTKHC